MKDKISKVLFFLLALVTLQQGIAMAGNYSRQWYDQAKIIEQQDIDPAALFYMESRLALKAEKDIRGKLTTTRRSM